MSQPCDICGVPATVVYDTPFPFDVRAVVSLPSTGRIATLDMRVAIDWQACEDCHRLIEDGDRDGLVRRARQDILRYAGVLARLPPDARRRLVREQTANLGALIDGFLDMRSPNPTPLAPLDDDEQAA